MASPRSELELAVRRHLRAHHWNLPGTWENWSTASLEAQTLDRLLEVVGAQSTLASLSREAWLSRLELVGIVNGC